MMKRIFKVIVFILLLPSFIIVLPVIFIIILFSYILHITWYIFYYLYTGKSFSKYEQWDLTEKECYNLWIKYEK